MNIASPSRFLVLGALIAGLFALHGLGDHQADDPHTFAHLAGSAAKHADAGVPTVEPSPMAGTATGCLAFLGLLLLALRRRTGRALLVLPMPDRPDRPDRSGAAVERAPPPFDLLSVRRC